MLKNYFKIAIRNIARNKVFAFINVLGLAIGISACLIIFSVTRYELSFDQFHPDKERIFRIVTEMKSATGDKHQISTIPDPAAKTIRASVSGLESVAMFHLMSMKVAIPDGDKIIKRFFPVDDKENSSKTILTDPQFFDVFQHEWLQGNKATALHEPFQVVISENEAKRYFGSRPLDEIMGRQIIYEDSLRLTVVGIVKDWTENSDLKFTDFISLSTVEHSYLKNMGSWDNWGGWNGDTQVFTKVTDHTNANGPTPQFAKIVRDNMKQMGDNKVSFLLQPLGYTSL